MRKQILFVVFCVAALIATAVQTTSAQRRSQYSYFGRGPAAVEACKEALITGNYVPYEPSFFNLYKPVSANKGEHAGPLEAPACQEMFTVKGYQVIVTKEGTMMVFAGKTIVRREDCGNPVLGTWYAAAPPPVEKKQVVAEECPQGTEENPENPQQCIEKKRLKTVATCDTPGAVVVGDHCEIPLHTKEQPTPPVTVQKHGHSTRNTVIAVVGAGVGGFVIGRVTKSCSSCPGVPQIAAIKTQTAAQIPHRTRGNIPGFADDNNVTWQELAGNAANAGNASNAGNYRSESTQPTTQMSTGQRTGGAKKLQSPSY